MSRGIFLISESNTLTELREQPYDSEALLQELVANYPAILAGDQIDREKPRRWLLVTREMGLASAEGGSSRWSVDHLLIDQDAVPTVVEVKRSTDTRIRREVVGQMLEYAANAIVYWPVESLRARFEKTCAERQQNPEEELISFLQDEQDADAFWTQVKTNLQAGKVRLVFVADEIPTELRRIIEFMNQQMDPAEVLGIEIKQYVAGGTRTLVPAVIGQTEEAQQRKSAGTGISRQWDEESFLAACQNSRTPDEIRVARKILEWAKANATRIDWGKGEKFGSFTPVLTKLGVEHRLMAVYTSGSVEVYFHTLSRNAPFASEELRLELMKRMNAIPGVAFEKDWITQRPPIRLSLLTKDESFQQFMKTYEWVIQNIKNTTGAPVSH